MSEPDFNEIVNEIGHIDLRVDMTERNPELATILGNDASAFYLAALEGGCGLDSALELTSRYLWGRMDLISLSNGIEWSDLQDLDDDMEN